MILFTNNSIIFYICNFISYLYIIFESKFIYKRANLYVINFILNYTIFHFFMANFKNLKIVLYIFYFQIFH